MKSILTMLALLAAVGVQAAEKADPAKGQPIANQVCASCHGADGNSANAGFPKLAGQHEAYIYKQLVEFKQNKRINPTMNGIAATLSDADMRNLSAYFAGQASKGGQATNKALVEQGRALYNGGKKENNLPACIACHGPNGAGIPVQFPAVSGQHAAYIAAQLQAYKTGQRNNDPNGVMRAIASKLSDDEIKAVAEYVSGLK